MWEENAKPRGIDLKDPIYKARLKRELDMIAEKQFEDYFYVISDMINYAKKHMLVGPSKRIFCWIFSLLFVKYCKMDPLKYDLLFERFIDATRKDLLLI